MKHTFHPLFLCHPFVLRHPLVLLLLACLLASCATNSHSKTIMMPMRDGVRLSTLILYPDGVKALRVSQTTQPQAQKRYPVILIRTPYKKELFPDKYRYLVDNGYVVVVQDVRGRFGSEGRFEPFINEGKDGYDAVEWLAAQPWCDGHVGMIGTSYDGWVQYCAAVEKPLHLTTIIPNCALADLFHDLPYCYGVFVPYALSWCDIVETNATADVTGQQVQAVFNRDWSTLLKDGPVSTLDERVLSKRLPYYQDWIRNDTKNAYWMRSSHLEALKNITIPVFIQTGWYDTQLRNSKLAYNALKEAGNTRVKLVIGPWAHQDAESKYLNGQLIGEAADDVDLRQLYVRWFDFWLKSTPNGILDEPLVQLYAINSDTWHTGNTYPLEHTTPKRLYLSASAQASPKLGSAGDLCFNVPPIREGSSTYDYNPDSVATFSLSMYGDYRSIKTVLEPRSDYLYYETAPLERPLTILGQLSATLYAASSAVDTDWFLTLLALDASGSILTPIGNGMLRAQFRQSLSTPTPLEPYTVYPFHLDLSHMGLALDKGQKIALIISSSFLYPYFAKNLNTGENNLTSTRSLIAHQRIVFGGDKASFVEVGVVEEGRGK